MARKENLKIVDVFTESQTAKEIERPVFNEMLRRIESRRQLFLIRSNCDFNAHSPRKNPFGGLASACNPIRKEREKIKVEVWTGCFIIQ